VSLNTDLPYPESCEGVLGSGEVLLFKLVEFVHILGAFVQYSIAVGYERTLKLCTELGPRVCEQL